MNDGIHNAVVYAARLTIDDHDRLVGNIELDYGGMLQGFGWSLAKNPFSAPDMEPRQAESDGPMVASFVMGVMEVAGVRSWHSIAGRPVRVLTEDSLAIGLGHFLNDRWFGLNPITNKPCLGSLGLLTRETPW